MNHPTDNPSDADMKLEAALRRLTPGAPSHNPFPTQHAPGIIPFPGPRRSRKPIIAIATAAAIAVGATITALVSPTTPPAVALPSPEPDQIDFDIEPIQQVGYLVDARPAPLIEIPGGPPLRPVRLRTVNTTLYHDHTTGSTITVGEPRDQLLLVPVSFH